MARLKEQGLKGSERAATQQDRHTAAKDCRRSRVRIFKPLLSSFYLWRPLRMYWPMYVRIRRLVRKWGPVRSGLTSQLQQQWTGGFVLSAPGQRV
ncbi:MAG: hypothetical protein OXM02_02695 [Bacteroidota bacterium]|nr:hypothetical protein [Bacteroidota bacterium]MDE2957446.1 hypothetical protein [Bacteroidota bacterium]